MTAMTDADREQRLDRFRQICAEVDALRARDELTREVFECYWRDAEEVLGDGQEAEAIESLGFLAGHADWLPDPVLDDDHDPWSHD